MRIADVIARIVDQCPLFEDVGHAFTSPAVRAYPACRVTPFKNVAQEPVLFGGQVGDNSAYDQMVSQSFGVFILMEAQPDSAFAATAAETFDDLCESVRSALTGWCPGDFPMMYAGGVLAPYATGFTAWREDFSIEFNLRIT